MQIQVNTDENVEGGENLSARVSDEIRTRLARFSQHMARVPSAVLTATGRNVDKVTMTSRASGW